MLAHDDQSVSGLMTKVQVMFADILPDTLVAQLHRLRGHSEEKRSEPARSGPARNWWRLGRHQPRLEHDLGVFVLLVVEQLVAVRPLIERHAVADEEG